MPATRRVLVTGAAGFLAAWIIPRLLERGHEVIASDLKRDERRLGAVSGIAAKSALQWIEADISSPESASGLAGQVKPDAIIHLAALQIPACRADPAAGARVNVVGHVNLLEAARRSGCRMIYTSSVAAKPRPPHNAPATLYGVYKHACEEISRMYAQDFCVSSLGLRPHVVYGVGRDAGETSAITEVMRAAAVGHSYTIPWKTRTCFQFAGDIAEMFVRAVEAEWQGAILADMSNEVESTDDVIAAVRAAVPHAKIAAEGPDRISPISGFDLEPLERIIGPLPRTPLQQGAARTIQMFQALNEGA